MTAVPWARPDLFLPLPAEAGPWGVARSDKGTIVLERVADAEALRRRLREDRSIYYAWTPGDAHLRPIYEIEEAAGAIEVRGAEELSRDLRRSLPWLALTIAALAVAVALWPGQRRYRFTAVVLLMLVVLPLWRRGVEGAFEAWRSLRRLRRDPVRWRALESSRIRFASWSGRQQSRVAMALVGALVATFLVAAWTGPDRAIGAFGLERGKVLAGEWWRLLSCAFLHGSPMHLFFNCAAGLSLAGIARSIVSEAHILGVFVLSAVAGSAASALLLGGPSIGASGAILGWGGLLLGMALAHRELRPTGLIANLMRWVVLLALIGVAGKGVIDNAAHAGGFLMGLAAGLWIARDRERPLPVGARLSRAGWAVVTAAAAAPWLWMLWVLARAKLL